MACRAPQSRWSDPHLAGAERVRTRAEAEVVRQQQRADAASLARAQRRFDAATAGRAAARARLTEAERRALSLTQGRDTLLTGQLAALEAQRRQDLDRLAEAEAEHRTMLDGRAATIRTTVAADPAYVAPDDGLLTRLRALKALTADPWVGAVVFLLEVFFAGIELAAVFAKLLSFVPATYATRLAQDDQIRQVTTAPARSRRCSKGLWRLTLTMPCPETPMLRERSRQPTHLHPSILLRRRPSR